MLEKISQLKDAKNLSKGAQKEFNGGGRTPLPWPPLERVCGGDGSFIFVNGQKVCCFVPSQQNYIC